MLPSTAGYAAPVALGTFEGRLARVSYARGKGNGFFGVTGNAELLMICDSRRFEPFRQHGNQRPIVRAAAAQDHGLDSAERLYPGLKCARSRFGC